MLVIEAFIYQSLYSFASHAFDNEISSYGFQTIRDASSYRKLLKFSSEYIVVYTLVIDDPSNQNLNWNIESAMNGIP